MAAAETSRMYRVAMTTTAPLIRGWGRLEVEGLDQMPAAGPVLLAGNHDSYWDPLAIGAAGFERRQICALAKSTLWNIPVLDRILDGMGQIPIVRGSGDVGALDRAIEELRTGRCIGVFLEGTSTRGRTLRARSGFGRLAAAVPEAQIVCATVLQTNQLAHFPRRRPNIRVRFFRPEGGGLQPGEDPKAFTVRLLAEIREQAPIPAPSKRQYAKYHKGREGASDDGA